MSEAKQWYSVDRPAIGFNFPNIPFLLDGDYKLTETGALPVYIALKAGKPELLGEGAADMARVRQIEGVIEDIKQAFLKVLFQTKDKA